MRYRLILSYLVVITIALLAVVFFAQQGVNQQVTEFLGRGGYMGANQLVTNLETYYAENASWEGVESILENSGPGGQGAMGQGKGNSQTNSGRGFSITTTLVDADGMVVYSGIHEKGEQIDLTTLEAEIAISVDNEVQGYLYFGGGMNAIPNPEFDTALLEIIQAASINAAWVSAVIALVLGLVLAALLTRPLQKLTAAASRLAEGRLDTRVSVESPVEMATLGNAFNQMAQSLEDAQASRKAMTADIAHELRTPLAVQRANLEALQDGVFPMNEENIAQLLSQNILLTRLVEDMRVLALVDAGELRLEKRPVQLNVLVEETADRFTARALEKGISLIVENETDVPNVIVDPERIQQVLYNLLQNGLRYTPAGGSVWIKAGTSKDKAIVKIIDSGPGIDDDALPHIFDRFYRADKARDREQGGTGLGLTIARQLMLAHDGDLTAANHSKYGAEFTMIFPA